MPTRQNIFDGTAWQKGVATVVTPAPAVLRKASEWPGHALHPVNIGLGVNVQLEAATDTRTAALLDCSPALNRTNWTVAYAVGYTTDPLVTITQLKEDGSGTVVATYTNYCHIPSGFNSAGGGYDGWSTVINEDETVYEFYNFRRVDDTHFTMYYTPVSNNVKGWMFGGGRRASMIPLVLGLITKTDIEGVKNGQPIHHAIATSGPENLLKQFPNGKSDGVAAVGADGTYLGTNSFNGVPLAGNGWVWPAKNADNRKNSVYNSGQTDCVALGSWFAIDGDLDISSLGLSTGGYAVAKAIQDYGMFIAATAATIPLMCAPDTDAGVVGTSSNTPGYLYYDWVHTIFPLLRVVKNNAPTSVSSSSMVPSQADIDTNVLGGSPRRVSLAPDFASGI